MGLGALSLLKRLRNFQSTVDGDGYPPSLTTNSDDDDDNSNHVGGGADPNLNPTRPKDHEPSKTKGTAFDPHPTHNPNDDSDDESGDDEPGSNPGTDPNIPEVGEDPMPGVGDPDSGHTTALAGPAETAVPTQVGGGPFTNPGIDPTVSTTAASGEDPTDTSEGVAASGGSGGGADSKKVAAIAVPVVVVCVALIVGLFFFMWRRKKKRQAAQASTYHLESSNPDMAQNNPTNGSQTHVAPLPPVNPIPTMRYDSPETSRSSPQEPLQNPSNDNNQRLSAISVQLQRAQQQPTVVNTQPQTHVKRNSIQQEGSTALTEENLATLGDTPQGYSYQRPRSPFEHPDDDDAVSAISGLSPGGNDPRNQGREADEVSAISSLEHAEMQPRRPQ